MTPDLTRHSLEIYSEQHYTSVADNYRCRLVLLIAQHSNHVFSFCSGFASRQDEDSADALFWCVLCFEQFHHMLFFFFFCPSFRRLNTLNKCASMKLDVHLPKKKVSKTHW